MLQYLKRAILYAYTGYRILYRTSIFKMIFYRIDSIILLRILVIFKLFNGNCAFILDRFHLTSSSSKLISSMSIKSFDFASSSAWDTFYRQEEKEQEMASAGVSSSTKTATEWHSSISLDEIASAVPPNGRCLVVGCGNSNLPDRILQRHDRLLPRSLVLLDTSPTCLDQLRERYQGTTNDDIDIDRSSSDFAYSNTEIEYVCGDATQLSKYFAIDIDEDDDDDDDEKKIKGSQGLLFDMIIDKGLTDAILCGEGWDGPLEKVLYESAKILSMGTGRYLLISYQLPSSTKEFLVNVGNNVGLEWEFDFDLTSSAPSFKNDDGKHQRVSVAMARRNTKTIQ